MYWYTKGSLKTRQEEQCADAGTSVTLPEHFITAHQQSH